MVRPFHLLTISVRYDANGETTGFTDLAGYTQTLSRVTHTTPIGEFPRPFDVDLTLTKQSGRQSRYAVNWLPGKTHREITGEDGTKTVMDLDRHDAGTVRMADGSSVSVEKSADPRFGWAAPYASRLSLTLPSGRCLVTTESRSAPGLGSNPLVFSNLVSNVSVNGKTWHSVYTPTSRVARATSPEGRTGQATLDALGRPVRVESPGLYPVQLAYDNRGRLSTVQQGEGAQTRVLGFAYGPDGWLSAVTNQRGERVEFYADRIGRVTNAVLPDAATVAATYAKSSLPASITVPGGKTNLFTYTPMYLASTWTQPPVPAVSNQTAWTWSGDRDLVLTHLPDGSAVSNRCNAKGQLDLIHWPGRDVGLSYDAQGRVTTMTNGNSSTLRFEYDGPLLTAQTWSGAAVAGTVSYTYNGDFAVTGLTVRADVASSVDYAFDRDGLLARAGDLTIGRAPLTGFATNLAIGGIAERLSFDGFGEPASYESRFGNDSLYGVNYGFDGLGRITSRVERVLGTTNLFAYAYDVRGRLTEVTTNGTVYSRYEYDANGNRTNWTVAGQSFAAAHDAQDRLLSVFRDGTTVAAFQYNGNGALTNRTDGTGATAFRFDAVGELLGVSLPDGTNVDYQTDPAGRRVSRAVNGQVTHRWLYVNGLKPVAELDADNRIVSTFVYGTGLTPDYMVKAGVKYRFIADQVGSVRLVVNAQTGAVAQQIDYDEFGRVLRDTNPGFQPFGFQGGLYDPLTGLVEFGARWYDPITGRWISKDPIGLGGGLNEYVFCGSCPVNFLDPTGLACKNGHAYLVAYANDLKHAWPWKWPVIMESKDIGSNNEGPESYAYLGIEVRRDQIGNAGPTYAITRTLGPVAGPLIASSVAFYGELATNAGLHKHAGLKRGVMDAISSFFWNGVGMEHALFDIFTGAP